MYNLKVYSISIMAFLPINDALELSFLTEAETNGEQTFIQHLPGIVPANSIEEAAEQARTVALGRWQINEGWYGHQASIVPITKEFFNLALDAFEAGVIDEITEEKGASFVF